MVLNLVESIEKEISNAISAFMLTKNIKNANFEKQVNISIIEKASIRGDFSTNIAMVIAQQLGYKNALDIAEAIINELANSTFLNGAYCIKPGFINFFINDYYLLDEIITICKKKYDYGDSNISSEENINIEFASANPTGPIHIGHIRGAVLGDSLSNILKKTGAKVTNEYYINDAGKQIDNLTDSVIHRINEILGTKIETQNSLQYPAEYVKQLAQKMISIFGQDFFNENKLNEEKAALLKAEIVNQNMQSIKKDLASINVNHDCFVSEKSLANSSLIEDSIKILNNKNLLYNGILQNPKGLQIDGWEPREQLLFKSSEFGDETDRPLQKADGSWTYFALDIAYHLDKIKRGFNHIIVILGKDHGSYSKRLSAAIKALSDEKVKFTPIMYDIVNIKSGNIVSKMSKRQGNFLTIKELLQKLDHSLIRILMLTRASNSVLDFDTKVAVEQSKDNPAFYIQYAHARSCSLINQSGLNIDDIKKLSLEIKTINISDNQERKLLINLCMWPKCLIESAKKLEPHRINFYLINTAKLFHSFWNAGKTDANMRFIEKNEPVKTAFRISIAFAVKNIIANGLSLMSVEAQKSM